MGIRVLKMGLGGPGVGVLGWARKDDGGRAGGRVMISSVCNICFFYVWEDCCCWGELGKVYGVRLKGIPQGFGLGRWIRFSIGAAAMAPRGKENLKERVLVDEIEIGRFKRG